MSKKTLLLVKLGGSIVTLKYASTPALRRSHVQNIAHVLKQQYNPHLHQLILIHGAGSFGHLHADKYGLAFGTKDQHEKLYRAVENQSLDAKLNSELTLIFIKAGLPVVGIPTRSIAVNQNGKLTSLKTDSIESALQVGAIPLLHGDMVFDRTWGFSILSGDVLLAKLAEQQQASKVFFASDVDGIFSEDPHFSKRAQLIPKISLNTMKNQTKLGDSHNKDVTGGLSKKFSYFQKDTPLKSIYFFNGLIAKNFNFVFSQKNFFGTIIENSEWGRLRSSPPKQSK